MHHTILSTVRKRTTMRLANCSTAFLTLTILTLQGVASTNLNLTETALPLPENTTGSVLHNPTPLPPPHKPVNLDFDFNDFGDFDDLTTPITAAASATATATATDVAEASTATTRAPPALAIFAVSALHVFMSFSIV